MRFHQLDNSTPCADYDVRRLLGHVVAVLRKLARVGVGGDARDVADPVANIDDGWAAAFDQARGELERVWADDAMLDQMFTLPWATLSGRAVLDAYTHEFTVHSWDLAHATGRLTELDADLAARALVSFREFVPAERRAEQGPFGPPVPVAHDADPYTQLAAYLGRQP